MIRRRNPLLTIIAAGVIAAAIVETAFYLIGV